MALDNNAEPRRRPCRRSVQVHQGRIRKAYPVDFKRRMCRIREMHPDCTIERFCAILKAETGWSVPVTTATKILERRAEWFDAKTLTKFKQRGGKWPEFEEVMLRWCTGWVRRHGTLTYATLKEQAGILARRMPELADGFSCSTGWAQGFCARHDLKLRRRCGEGGDANQAAADLGRDAIPYILRTLGARPEDTFNCDETGIIFSAQPYRTLTPISVTGTKKAMDRYTALMCCNATGTEKLKLLMCGTMQRARDWGPINAENAWHPLPYVYWQKSAKGWMTREIFNAWLGALRGDFKMQGRKLFLIMDNCSAHFIVHPAAKKYQIRGINVSTASISCDGEVFIYNPTYVCSTCLLQVIQIEDCYCIMLPPNCTSVIQPLDQGIIGMVKSRYRKWFLRWVLSRDNLANGINDEEQQAASDSDEERDDEVVPVAAPGGQVHHIKASLRRGIRKLSRVWANLEPIHIWNCWRKSGIMPQEWENLYAGQAVPSLEREYEDLTALIQQVHLNPQNRMNAREYVHDVCGENEREAINSEEDRTPPPSADSVNCPSDSPSVAPPMASPSQNSTGRQPSLAAVDVSAQDFAPDSEESRVYPCDVESPLWDGIQCGQDDDLTFMDMLNLDLNQ